MPKRSNEFQKLVYLIKKQMAGTGTVTESKLLLDRLTESEREVDICIESLVGGHKLVISIECQDRERPADVSWVEQMKAKHERLPTNALVLVSRSGLTTEALKVAKLSGIETLAFEDLGEQAVARIFGPLGTLWAKELTLSPTKVVIRVAAVNDLRPEDVATTPDNWIHSIQGDFIATVKEYVEVAFKSVKVLEMIGKDATDEHVAFVIEWASPTDEDGQPLCLKKIEPSVLRPIEHVRVHGSISCRIIQFHVKHGKLGEVKVAWGIGTLFGKPSMLVASQAGSEKEILTLHVEGAP